MRISSFALSGNCIKHALYAAGRVRARKPASLAAVLLLAACASPSDTSFHDRLYQFANAGMVRVGDLTGGRIDATRLYGTRECAALTNPNAQLLKAEFSALRTLCVKPAASSIEVAGAL